MTRPRPLVPRGDPADTVRVVGEFGVIARVLAQAGTARSAEVGPGDDAAVRARPGRAGRRDHRRPRRGPALPAGLVLARGHRAQGGRGQPRRRRRDGRGDLRAARGGRLPAGHPDRLAGGRGRRPGGGVRPAGGRRRRRRPGGGGLRQRLGGHLGDGARRPLRAAGRCSGRARGPATSWRSPGAWAGRPAASPSSGGASAARSPPWRRTAGPRRPTRPDRPRRTPGRARCATSATGCSPTSGTSPRTAA